VIGAVTQTRFLCAVISCPAWFTEALSFFTFPFKRAVIRAVYFRTARAIKSRLT
jgi:hypothetical protein